MIVLDSSALVDVVADRPAKEVVLSYLDQPLAAPAHQPAEVISAIGRLLRAGELTPESAQRAVSEAATLVQDVTPIDEAMLLRSFALRESVRVLDGPYVALAERYGCPLLTTDGRLARADLPCEVILATAPA